MIKNKKAQLGINIFVLGTLIVCVLALFSFSTNSNKVKFNFYGISALEEENTKIENEQYQQYLKLKENIQEFKCSYQDLCQCPKVDSPYNKLIINNMDINDLISNVDCSNKELLKNNLFNLMKSISDTNAEYVASQCKCKDNCKNYAGLLVDEACKDDNNKIDPYLLLSIMMQESDCVALAINSNKESNGKVSSSDCGLMQINTKSQEDCKDLIQNPASSIKRAVSLLKDKFDKECIFTGGKYENGNFECDASTLIMNSGCTRSVKYSGWASKIRGYNGWGAGGSSYYSELVLERYLELKGLKEKLTVNEVKSYSNNIKVDYNFELNVLSSNNENNPTNNNQK